MTVPRWAFYSILEGDFNSGRVPVLFRADRETAARITEEIGNLMKEIETLVVEKTKESSDITKMVKDGEQDGLTDGQTGK